MSLDSNAQRGRDGKPHFTFYPTPGSAAIDVLIQDLQNCDGMEINAYCFRLWMFYCHPREMALNPQDYYLTCGLFGLTGSNKCVFFLLDDAFGPKVVRSIGGMPPIRLP